jgi:hypothetical protein
VAGWLGLGGGEISEIRADGRLQLGPARTDSIPMNARFLRTSIAIGACLLGTSGCIGNKGTPVFVDYGAMEVWSGEGLLVEVSPDQTQCRVIVRDNFLIRRDRWVQCIFVHARRQR